MGLRVARLYLPATLSYVTFDVGIALKFRPYDAVRYDGTRYRPIRDWVARLPAIAVGGVLTLVAARSVVT